MTGRPAANRQPTPEEAHSALARVFGVEVDGADPAPAATTAPELPAEEAERRAAMGRVFGTEV